MWQGCLEGEDKHCDGVFSGIPEKNGDGVGNLGSAKWCCSEGGDENTPVPEMIMVVVLWVVQVPKRWTPEG